MELENIHIFWYESASESGSEFVIANNREEAEQKVRHFGQMYLGTLEEFIEYMDEDEGDNHFLFGFRKTVYPDKRVPGV